MRAVVTMLMWIVTTVSLAAAIPAMWAQQNLVSRDGYAALARQAATEPALQSAMAGELVTQVGRLGSDADSILVGGIARAYTSSPSFPGQFGQANAFAHRWLFTNTVGSTVDERGRWVIDLAPMLSDAAFTQTLRDSNIAVPSELPIPLTGNAPAFLRPGALSVYGRWAPWLSWGLVIVAAGSALLMLAVARSRGKALAALGVSGLIVGAVGWGAVEYAQRYLRAALNDMSGDLRQVAEVMTATAQAGVHHWLNMTLIGGAGLIAIGVVVSLLGSLR